MAKAQRPKSLIAAAVLLLALSLVPFGNWVLLPLAYLNTHIHEFGHALAALASGGHGMQISVFPDGSGVTTFSGGWPWLEAPAGYIGATLVGGTLLLLGRKPETARAALAGLAAVLSVSLIFWVRNVLGFGTGIFYVFVLAAMARSLKPEHARFAAQFLGLHQCLASVQSLLVLYQLNAQGHVQNDAAAMAQATGIPSLVWALLWCALSGVIVVSALRKST